MLTRDRQFDNLDQVNPSSFSNRRNSSVFSQLSQTTRHNLQQFSSDAVINSYHTPLQSYSSTQNNVYK